MFDGCRVALLFQTNLYAKQPTAEELLKPGIKYWHSSEERQPVNSYVTVTTRTTRSPFGQYHQSGTILQSFHMLRHN